MDIPQDSYVVMAQMGHCKVCKRWQDLRCGACSDCSDKVAGRLVSHGVHELWERNNPTNKWVVNEHGS